jgi:hypothetical protein
MTDALRVILEIGPKRRVVADAMDWPGLDRWSSSDQTAIETLTTYLPRYADVAKRAGLADEFARTRRPEVVERVPGSSSTDFWGVPHVPSQIEREVLPETDLERRLALLQAAWAYFDDVANRVTPELRKGARGAGRDRDEIIEHVYGSERHQMWRKVGYKQPEEVALTSGELAEHRSAYLDAIRAYNAERKSTRSWPIQFLIRRTAHHVMDHAWEMEDKDLR